MHHEALNHPKTKNLADKIYDYMEEKYPLRICHHIAVSTIDHIQGFCCQYANDGAIGRYSDRRIAQDIGWEMNDAVFIMDALIDCGFIDLVEDEKRLVYHDWSEYAPEFIHKRLARKGKEFADKTAPRRAKVGQKKDKNPIQYDGGRTVGAHAADNVCPTAARQNRTEQNKTEVKTACPEQSEIFLEFPIKDGSGRAFAMTKEKLDEYKKTYRRVDTESECRKARQWLIDNPAKRKTEKGMTRFLNSWLSRANDSTPEEDRRVYPKLNFENGEPED